MYARGVGWFAFVFIESTVFDRLRGHYLNDDEYSDLQQFMMLNPEAGATVRGSRGVRNSAGGGRGAPASVADCE